MDFNHLTDNKSKLFDFMKENGYSYEAICSTKTTIDFLLSHNCSEWKNYDDVRKTVLSFYPNPNSQSRRIAALNRIIMFDLYDAMPSWKRYSHLDRISHYYSLCDHYRNLIDHYRQSLLQSTLAEKTIYSRTHAAASLLLRIQNKGIYDLANLTENDVVELFWNDGQPFEKTYRNAFKDFLKRADIIPKEIRQNIIWYIPKKKKKVNNKQYLTKTEVEAVVSVLKEETALSLRDRAIGSLLFYTGLRSIDICNLKLADIDWENDQINIIQNKTDVPLSLPLDPAYGNLIYDYIYVERHESKSEYLFISSRRPYEKLTSSAVGSRIVNNIFDAAQKRTEKGKRRGSHIFRHNIVSMMLDKGINNTLISSILGHTSSSSVEPYLNTDFSHLKECALSIECYPLSGGSDK